MNKSSIMAMATVLLLATGGVALAEQAGTAANQDVECNQVFKAKAGAGKSLSSEQLARDLNLPVEQVNTCLLRLRQHPPRTPQAGQ